MGTDPGDPIVTAIEQVDACYDYCAAWKEPASACGFHAFDRHSYAQEEARKCGPVVFKNLNGSFQSRADALDGLSRYTEHMLRSIQPLHFLLTLLAGWINRRQLEAIDYLIEENRLLKERLGGRRLRFTDAERRRLARRAYALGRKALSELVRRSRRTR